MSTPIRRIRLGNVEATHVLSRISVDGSDQTGSSHATGNDFAGTVGTMLVQKLGVGDHRFTPRYRTPSFLGMLRCSVGNANAHPSIVDSNGTVPHQTGASRVINLGPDATILLQLLPTAQLAPTISTGYRAAPG